MDLRIAENVEYARRNLPRVEQISITVPLNAEINVTINKGLKMYFKEHKETRNSSQVKNNTLLPRIEFERTSQDCYSVYYDRQVLMGTLARRGRTWIFFPTDLDGMSAYSMKALIEKIEWLDSRIAEEKF